MTPEQLLRESEKLTYKSRMRRMVELGQLASNDASIRKTIAVFAQARTCSSNRAIKAGQWLERRTDHTPASLQGRYLAPGCRSSTVHICLVAQNQQHIFPNLSTAASEALR
jgi:hypothetical protein